MSRVSFKSLDLDLEGQTGLGNMTTFGQFGI